MAKPKTVQASTKQPTFADAKSILEFWDYEEDAPCQPSAADLEDYETAEAMGRFHKAFWAWRRIEIDEDEAAARAEYASHAAQYLAGIFPNARVNVAAYGEAAGEELGRFSADIVKIVAERARRTSKTLPSIAQLVEWAEAESERRWRQERAYIRAMVDHESAVNRGRDQATQLQERLQGKGIADAPAAETLLGLYRGVVEVRWGLDPSTATQRETARKLRAVFTRMEQGDMAALQFAREHGAKLLAARLEQDAAEEAFNAAMTPETDARFDAAIKALNTATEDARAALEALGDGNPPKPATPPVASPATRVAHAKFGLGTVTARDGDTVEVQFDQHGLKRVLARFLTEEVTQ